ncbi:E3 ubiquitin-protein ligase TRIM33-like [Condylostylus longicornis]|uniref:E3 ubiquitin-protein ligase TRIM33-like n=1 Tax=Condylostylus longicornis TaxID=2530218 RepID=UPI00244E1045|nr:E3 ubiquitin-protein ligase TRIM33-like [Condylostylus longicornis]
MSVDNFRNFNLVSSWKPPFRCAVCEKNKLALNQNHRPFILKCFHDVCEKCVISSLKTRSILTCKLCYSKTEIKSKQMFREEIEPSHFLRGVIGYTQHILPYDMQYIEPQADCSNANIDMIPMFDESKNYECNECTIANTQYYCVQCNVPYCLECYENIHKTARVLKKHNLVKIKTKMIPTEKKNPQVCEKHKTICEHFCKACQKITCKDCIPINHSQHQHRVISLIDENKRFIKELNKIVDVVKETKMNYEMVIECQNIQALP